MYQLCLFMGLDEFDMKCLDKIIGCCKVVCDDFLYCIGDCFIVFYVVCVGYFKIYQENFDGDCQIIGFQMFGELLGMDVISIEYY